MELRVVNLSPLGKEEKTAMKILLYVFFLFALSVFVSPSFSQQTDIILIADGGELADVHWLDSRFYKLDLSIIMRKPRGGLVVRGVVKHPYGEGPFEIETASSDIVADASVSTFNDRLSFYVRLADHVWTIQAELITAKPLPVSGEYTYYLDRPGFLEGNYPHPLRWLELTVTDANGNPVSVSTKTNPLLRTTDSTSSFSLTTEGFSQEMPVPDVQEITLIASNYIDLFPTYRLYYDRDDDAFIMNPGEQIYGVSSAPGPLTFEVVFDNGSRCEMTHPLRGHSIVLRPYCDGLETDIQLDTEPSPTLVDPPTGFTRGEYSFGSVPSGEGSNGQGLTMTLDQSEGLTWYGPVINTGKGLVHVRCFVRVSSPDVSVALGALNVPAGGTYKDLDGSIGTNQPVDGEEFVDRWAALDTVIDPADDGVVPVLQAVSDAPGTVHVYWDNLVVSPLQNMSPQGIHELMEGRARCTLAPTFTPTPDIHATPTPSPTPHAITVDLPGRSLSSKRLEFVYIPAGTFLMGSPPDEHGRDEDENQHSVTISSPFYMAKYEVTYNQFMIFLHEKGDHSLEGFTYFDVDSSPYVEPRNGGWALLSAFKDHPVGGVSWYGARDFAAWISELHPELKCRLPTEAEWEYACRAGTQTRFYWGSANANDYAWYSGNSESETHQVGQKPPNAWGLYDMSGNVWEWCMDPYGDYPLGDVVIDPSTIETDDHVVEYRVARGGAATSAVDDCRSAERSSVFSQTGHTFHGFRIMAVIDEE